MIFKYIIGIMSAISFILILSGAILNFIAVFSNDFRMPIKDPKDEYNIKEINKERSFLKMFKYKKYKKDSEVNFPSLTDRHNRKIGDKLQKYSLGDRFMEIGAIILIINILIDLIFVFIICPIIPK